MMERVGIIVNLRHEQTDQLLFGIDPEGGSSGTTPAETSYGFRRVFGVFIIVIVFAWFLIITERFLITYDRETESKPVVVMRIPH